MIKLKKTPEFEQWISGLQIKEQAQVKARLSRIEEHGHFGDIKPIYGLANALFELRWANGWRIYFYREGIANITLLLGGKKNDQKKDIKKAEVLLRRYANLEN